jgi:hypothetical protein
VSGWLDPLRGKSREYVAEVDEACRRHRTDPRAAMLLLRFRDTTDGKRFTEGKPLTPQFGAPRQTQAWARMSLDWLE